VPRGYHGTTPTAKRWEGFSSKAASFEAAFVDACSGTVASGRVAVPGR